MKRILAAVAVALCLWHVPMAGAEAGQPVRLGDGIPTSTYWKQHGIATADCAFPAFASSREKLTQLQGENAPDLFGLDTRNDDFEAFKTADVLADLSGSAAIREAVAHMRPEMQRLLTTAEGRIVAMPSAHVLYPLYWDQAAWDAAGLTAADVPQSFTELLDFLESWMAREPTGGSVCVIAYPDDGAVADADCDAAWLVGLLLTTWETQQRYADEPVVFDSPDFIALAERAREVGQRLHQSEPALKKRKQMLQLF